MHFFDQFIGQNRLSYDLSCIYSPSLLILRKNEIDRMTTDKLLMLNVGHATHRGDWNFRDINSPFTRIYYVTEGTGWVTFDTGTHELLPGNMYIIPAFTRHSDSCSGLFRHYYIHIYEDVTSGEGIIDSYEFPFGIEGHQLDATLFEALCEHNSAMALKHPDPSVYDTGSGLIECVRVNRNRPVWDRMESIGIICQLLGRFIRHARPKYQSTDPRVRQAIAIVNRGSSERVRVESIAADVGLSVDHLIRLFRRDLGCTPAQFIIDKKMMKAKLMLASEDMPSKEVAYMLGYDDFSYFTRLFRRTTGLTPNQYRKSFNTPMPEPAV